MIKEKKAVTLTEVQELLKEIESDKAKALLSFIKKFVKTNANKAEKLKQELLALDIAKLKEKDIVSLINFMPEDAEDIRKIFTGSEISLDQNEITKILELFKRKE